MRSNDDSDWPVHSVMLSLLHRKDEHPGVLIGTAAEVLGKARTRKRPRATNDILDLCDKREASRRDEQMSQ